MNKIVFPPPKVELDFADTAAVVLHKPAGWGEQNCVAVRRRKGAPGLAVPIHTVILVSRDCLPVDEQACPQSAPDRDSGVYRRAAPRPRCIESIPPLLRTVKDGLLNEPRCVARRPTGAPFIESVVPTGALMLQPSYQGIRECRLFRFDTGIIVE